MELSRRLYLSTLASLPASTLLGGAAAAPAPRRNAVQTEWERTYDASASDAALGVLGTVDGSSVFVGRTETASGQDGWARKVDGDGDTVWEQQYGFSGERDWFTDVAQTGRGYLCAGQTTLGAAGLNGWLTSIDEEGYTYWDQDYGGSGEDRITSVQVTASGDALFAGATTSFGNGGYDAWLARVDSQGDKQNEWGFGGSGADYAFGNIRTADDGFLLTGQTASFGSGGTDAWLIKTDGDVTLQWNETYGTSGDDYARATHAASDGYVVAGASAPSGGNSDGWVFKIDDSGNKQWEETLGGDGTDSFVDVTPAPDGGYLLVGATTSFGTASERSTWVAKVDDSGTIQWHQPLDASGPDYAEALSPVDDDSYVLAGRQGSSATTGRLLQFAPTGADAPSLSAAFRVDETAPTAGDSVVFDASDSEAPSGSTYAWDADGDGTAEGSGESFRHQFAEVGEQTVELRVSASGRTATASDTLQIRLPNSDTHLSKAATIDELTVTEQRYEQMASRQTQALNDAVASDTLAQPTGEEVLERYLLGDQFTEAVVTAVGDPEYTEGPTDYDLALDTADTALRLVSNIAMMAISFAGGKIAKKVSGRVTGLLDSVAQRVMSKISGLMDDVLTKIIDFVAGLASQAAKRLDTNAQKVAEEALGIAFDTTSSLALDHVMDTIEDQIAAVKQGIAEFFRTQIEKDEDRPGTETEEEAFNDLDDGLALLDQELEASTVASTGLAGSYAGAQQAVQTGREKFETQVAAMHQTLTMVEEKLSELGLIQNLVDLWNALNRGDGVDVIMELLWTIASLAEEFIAFGANITAGGLGLMTMFNVSNIHYTTLDGIASGESKW